MKIAGYVKFENDFFVNIAEDQEANLKGLLGKVIDRSFGCYFIQFDIPVNGKKIIFADWFKSEELI